MENTVPVDKKAEYNDPSWWKTALAISVVNFGILPASIWTRIKAEGCFEKLYNKYENSITSLEEKSIFQNAQNALERTGLREKGVEILRAGNTGITDWAPNVKFNFRKRLIQKQAKCLEGSILNGNNAVFHNYVNKIIIPPEGKGCTSAVFHEIGHAMNFNKGIVGKTLSFLRQWVPIIIIPLLFASFLAPKKAKEEHQDDITLKTVDYVKNNAGKLSFAMFLPTILEEGLATFKGLNLARNVVSSSTLSKMAKVNAVGLMSYVANAAIVSAGVFGAFLIKDLIAKRTSKEKKPENNKITFKKDIEVNSTEK